MRARKTELAAVLGDSSELRTVACLLPETASAEAAVGVWVAGRRVGTATPTATRYDQLCADFVGSERILSVGETGMAPWRERQFIVMHRNAAPAQRAFMLPSDQVMSIGSTVEI